MALKLIGLIVPLGLDTFAVAAALGLAGLKAGERLRISLLFTSFEVGMPLLGFFAGRLVGQLAGGVADGLAIVILIVVGASMLRPGADDSPGEGAARRPATRGWAAIVLGLSISLDELAIGFTIGLLELPILVIVALIGVQTFVLTQLGLFVGRRLGEHLRQWAERLAGIALVGLGVVLLVEHVRR